MLERGGGDTHEIMMSNIKQLVFGFSGQQEHMLLTWKGDNLPAKCSMSDGVKI